jgi:hypothetical protein
MNATLLGSALARGGRRIVFAQTDDSAVLHGPFVELRPLSDDVNAYLVTHGLALSNSLTAGEIAAVLARIVQDGSLAVIPALRYATIDAVRAALRALYLTATRAEAIMLGDFLGTLTDTQLRALFGMTQIQVNSLRTNKLGPAATQATAIRSAAGA